MKISDIWMLIKQTVKEWSEDKAARLAAALSYYTVFSLAPFLVIVIAIIGVAFGQSTAKDQIISQVAALIGEDGAGLVEGMLVSAGEPSNSIPATIVGIILLIFGASGFFGQLQEALNTIWEVRKKPGGGILKMIKARFFSFTMILGVGFLLLVSLVVSTGLSALGNYMTGLLPGVSFLIQVANLLISFAVITVLFALMFKILPDAEIAWKDVWLGAAVTSLLFTIGKTAIGLYLGSQSLGSTYGAAGSLVVLLLWVYYSAQILFFGAEFTQVYAHKFGSGIVPEKGAERITEQERVQQGMSPRKENTAASAVPKPPVSAQGTLTAIPGTGRNDLKAFDPPYEPRDMRTDIEPVEKSMIALGVLSVGIVSMVGNLLIKKVKH